MLARTFRVALITTAILMVASTPAWARDGAWEQRLDSRGGATVNADRDKITVCDNVAGDDTYVRAKYTTSYNMVFTVEAPQGDCASDRTWISYIKSFQVCWGHGSFDKSAVWDDCLDSVITK